MTISRLEIATRLLAGAGPSAWNEARSQYLALEAADRLLEAERVHERKRQARLDREYARSHGTTLIGGKATPCCP